MDPFKSLPVFRDKSNSIERALPTIQRKHLGQFFTGMEVGRLLANLAIDENTRSVFDPMAGTGDLLDSVFESVRNFDRPLSQLNAVDVDPKLAELCQQRLSVISAGYNIQNHVVCGDAFDATTYENLPEIAYDLVIANPPFVRSQILGDRKEIVRNGLAQIVASRLSGVSREIWDTLVKSYSGLADLSIPAGLLCASMVRPGGRLAVVASSTWRSRRYAHVIRYLLLRAFKLEVIVESAGHDWFSGAQVNTLLIIARRLEDQLAEIPLNKRSTWPVAHWLTLPIGVSSLSALAESSCTLVGASEYLSILRKRTDVRDHGLNVLRAFRLDHEWSALRFHSSKERWFKLLETNSSCESSYSRDTVSDWSRINNLDIIPLPLRDLLSESFLAQELTSANELGIQIGQGLRTGCNRFFYVEIVEESEDWCTVITHKAMGRRILQIPASALRPVIHKQSEIARQREPTKLTHVLDLRNWILPEDLANVEHILPMYERLGYEPPKLMPPELAEYVRFAAEFSLSTSGDSKPISEMTAVQSNVRNVTSGKLPRFWYMLPDFTPRHTPRAFLPRVIHGIPRTLPKFHPELLVDANFLTIWSDQACWTPRTLSHFFSSTWCQCYIELSGTRLGGGALKLESTQLKNMLIPKLDEHAIADLRALDARSSDLVQSQIDDTVLRGLFNEDTEHAYIGKLANNLHRLAKELCSSRRNRLPISKN